MNPEIDQLKSAENRIFARVIEMMRISTWPKREKTAALQPSITVWRNLIFAQLARGVPESVILDYLKKQLHMKKSFRGVPAFLIFRDLERSSFTKMDRAYDAIKTKRHRAAVDSSPASYPSYSPLDLLCQSLEQSFRRNRKISLLTSTVRSIASSNPPYSPDKARRHIELAAQTAGIRLKKSDLDRILSICRIGPIPRRGGIPLPPGKEPHNGNKKCV